MRYQDFKDRLNNNLYSHMCNKVKYISKFSEKKFHSTKFHIIDSLYFTYIDEFKHINEAEVKLSRRQKRKDTTKKKDKFFNDSFQFIRKDFSNDKFESIHKNYPDENFGGAFTDILINYIEQLEYVDSFVAQVYEDAKLK